LLCTDFAQEILSGGDQIRVIGAGQHQFLFEVVPLQESEARVRTANICN
jgi:hypothetical protein